MMEVFFAIATIILVYFIIFQTLFAQQSALSMSPPTPSKHFDQAFLKNAGIKNRMLD